jgi:hypothetical protein
MQLTDHFQAAVANRLNSTTHETQQIKNKLKKYKKLRMSSRDTGHTHD